MFARTARLLLRPGWTEDAPALFEAMADEAIVRNLATAPWPYRFGHAETFLATKRSRDNPVMLILLRTARTPKLVGTIGFARRPDGEVELGYWIARRYWNRGFATEAGRAVVAMARESFRVPRLVAGHFVDNPASGRVLEKLGFRPTGAVLPRYSTGRGGSAPCKLYALNLSAAEPAADGEPVPAVMAA